MGMFDKTESLTKQSDFDISLPFMLWDAEFIGTTVSRVYGENVTATVVAGPVNLGEDAAKSYTVFGVLAEMVQRQKDGDLPAKVTVQEEGQAKVFVPVQ